MDTIKVDLDFETFMTISDSLEFKRKFSVEALKMIFDEIQYIQIDSDSDRNIFEDMRVFREYNVLELFEKLLSDGEWNLGYLPDFKKKRELAYEALDGSASFVNNKDKTVFVVFGWY